MNTEPIYELRERLRAAAIAGTNLLSEDFRLKRAYEAFKPLEAASPVFAKVGQMTGQLLSSDCQNPQGALLDTITLADAVICTLGAVDAAGEIQLADILKSEETAANSGSVIVNAPYSTLKELLDALTTSGSGHYGYVCDTHKKHPELFRDYRVKYALVQALSAPYSELAENVEQWLKEDNDKAVLPLLYKAFDAKGKKEMVRRVRVIDALAGAGANDFYVKMLDGAEKDIRFELINALRHEPANAPLLLDLLKTEKGKNRDVVIDALANMADDRAEAYFREISGKKPETVLKCLKNATSAWSAELVSEICDNVLEKFDKLGDVSDWGKKETDTVFLLYHVIRALFGKNGSCICQCYRNLLERKDRINYFLEESRKQKDTKERLAWQFDILRDNLGYCERLETHNTEGSLGMVLHQSLLINPAADLQALAMELYGGGAAEEFLAAAVTVKFLNDEDCVQWLDAHVRNAANGMKMMNAAAAYISWKGENYGYRFYGRCSSSCLPELLSFERFIKLSHAKEIIKWFKTFRSQETDTVLACWLPLNDAELCKEMGEYFYKRALEVTNLTGYNRKYLAYMRSCGWKECKGLGVKIVKSLSNNVTTWELYSWLTTNAWDKDAVMEEAEAICNMAKNGKITSKAFHVNDFEKYIKNWYGN